MMKTLQRYIAKQVIIATALVFVMVTALSFMIGLLRELHDIGGDYTFWQAMLHDLLQLPYNVYQIFPMMILLGGVLGLGGLASSHELMVMRTAGISITRIVLGVLSAALVLIVFATLLGEWLSPTANDWADKQKSFVKSHGQVLATKTGVWIHEGNNFLHVNQVIGLQHLEGVARYEFDAAHQLLAAYYVQSMDFEHGQWSLHHLVKTRFKPDQITTEQTPKAHWNLMLTPNLLTVGLIEPEAMSLKQLAQYSHYFVKNRLQANSFQLQFWQRLFQPLSTLVMVLLAVPFVFTAPRSITMGRRIFMAIIMGFIFYMLNALVGQSSVVYQLPPLIAAILPTFVFAAIGYVWMKRAHS